MGLKRFFGHLAGWGWFNDKKCRGNDNISCLNKNSIDFFTGCPGDDN
jgi:hypothetical protein